MSAQNGKDPLPDAPEDGAQQHAHGGHGHAGAPGAGAQGDIDAETGDFDLVRRTMLDPSRDPQVGLDLTLGGYLEKHDRPPAFLGADDRPYTVAVDVEATDEAEAPFVAFLIFVRWADTGAGIMGHIESGDVARGETEEAAREAALALTLFEVRAELDDAIAGGAAEHDGAGDDH